MMKRRSKYTQKSIENDIQMMKTIGPNVFMYAKCVEENSLAFSNILQSGLNVANNIIKMI